MRKKLKVINLYWTPEGWMLFHAKSKRKVRHMQFQTLKRMAYRMAQAYGQWWARVDRPISIRIHDKLGQYEREWTYPRSADPRRSKG